MGVLGEGGCGWEGWLGVGEGEGNLGVKLRVMAWTPWKVPARMSISLAERWWSGEVLVVGGVGVVVVGGAFCAGMKFRW